MPVRTKQEKRRGWVTVAATLLLGAILGALFGEAGRGFVGAALLCPISLAMVAPDKSPVRSWWRRRRHRG